MEHSIRKGGLADINREGKGELCFWSRGWGQDMTNSKNKTTKQKT
jgi:hypothetical protein